MWVMRLRRRDQPSFPPLPFSVEGKWRLIIAFLEPEAIFHVQKSAGIEENKVDLLLGGQCNAIHAFGNILLVP